MAQPDPINFTTTYDDSPFVTAFNRFLGNVDKSQEAVDKLSKDVQAAMNSAAKETETFNKELAKTEKAAAAPAKAITQTNAAIDGLIKRNQTLATVIADLEKAKKRDGSITDAQARKMEGARKEIEENEAVIKKLTAATNENSKATEANADASKKQGEDAGKSGGKLVSFSSILKDIAESGGDVKGALERASAQMKENGQSAGSLFKGMFSLKNIATGVAGAFVALVGVSLAAYFKNNEEAANKLSDTFAGFGEQAKVVGGRLSDFGGSLVRVFQGEAVRGEVLEKLTNIFSNYGDELERAKTLGEELNQSARFLEALAAQTIPVLEKRIGQEARYRDAVSNTNAGFNARLGALNKASQVSSEIERTRIFEAEQQLAAIQRQNLELDGTVKQTIEVSKAEQKLIKLRNDAASRERSDAATARQIRQERADKLDEERKKVEALNKAYEALLSRLAQRVEQAQISELLGTDKLQAEKEAALKEVDAFVNEIAAAASAAGRSLPEGFASDIQDLVSAVETEFRKAVDKLRQKDGGVFDQLLLPKDRGAGLENEAQQAFKRLNKVFEGNLPLLQRIKDGIASAFGLSREELENGFKEISAGFNLAFGNFITGLDAATEAQISAQDKVIERRREQVEELQELLDIELQRQKDGFANSVGAREKELAEKQALLEAAETKRAALEEKAARRTLIINSVQQASEATLTVARLLSASAKLGIFGFIAAAAVGVSTVFSILAQAKAQSAKFATAPGFKGGTPFLDGAGNGKSDSIPVWASKGERIMPAHLNEILGGAKMPNDLLVKYALSGMERERKTAEDVSRRQANIDGHKYARDAFAGLTRDDMAELMREVVNKMDEIPKHFYGPDGSKVVERKKGGKIIRQTVDK